ncbi:MULTISPECIES: argininosuccinate lyase [Clostridium]|jgi:argininosuccinate lyase|uniref:Argininosuccinate lyase n=4 Tax=Clostridium TaxID=1485 RepID=D8GNB7_CLOLD|nr:MULTISPECIES: argininosuccinate lyase [Clostridium]ADK13741.1 argininosuccinate lyase [Clostridium ljungdahlii DSM 13528]AGY76969.1 argininosuccinate lyase [Clostridium autoethanogenum DSM 10061]ALU37111.1 Argininosuccinate lyase [Clostridium autoethanogenum DSM 10061]OAA84988.1 Argininosuccinate lyase 1 [Clostridium ljungdahlii DSM 13528]OAA85556.1 Argininosuccinate lyase 1 [Clostridium coskatii]
MKLWGGRFKKSESKLMEDFNSSLSFDKLLYSEDIEGSMAHVKMLSKCNILSKEEGESILKGLQSILSDIEDGKLKIEGDYEDIHTFVEVNLIERVGQVGKKLHTARSRNDQVAVDFRLYCKKSALEVIKNIEKLQDVIKNLGENNNIMMPGYTHLQRAQVVTFKHHIMAYYNMLKRDKARISNAVEIMDENPLGCCALAGTTYNIDRSFTAKELGFKKPVDNFLDGVSDRDYVLELLSNFSIIMMHLSRLSEELILWSSKEFDFVQIDDEFSTGSSIMPQKKNPDAAELIRGKTGRVYGSLMSLLTTMKGIPLAYNKDMQEDKEQFFNSLDTVLSCLKVMSGMLSTLKIKKDNTFKAVKRGFLNATEAADYLVNKGMAFRDAHKVIGEIVLYCEERDKAIEDVSVDELKKFSSLFSDDVYEFINYENTLNRGIKKNLR